MSKTKPEQNIAEHRRMPRPTSLLSMTWKDIADQAESDCETLTRDQVIEVFRNVCAADRRGITEAYRELLSAEIASVIREAGS